MDSRSVSTLLGNEGGEYLRQDHDMRFPIFNFPNGLHYQSLNLLFFTDCNRIKLIDLEKKKVQHISGQSSTLRLVRGSHKDGPEQTALFDQPSGIVEKDEIIFVCDSGNHCIRKIEADIVSTIAGIPRVTGHRDGSLEDALFFYPQGVYHTLDGLLVADMNGLRHIDIAKGKVTTLIREHGCQSITADRHGKLYLGGANGLFSVDSAWRLERYLWIGWKKEDTSYCHLARLPVDLIREISAYLSM